MQNDATSSLASFFLYLQGYSTIRCIELENGDDVLDIFTKLQHAYHTNFKFCLELYIIYEGPLLTVVFVCF